jgi:hypothetical protein
MQGVRQGARAVLRFLVPLYFVAVVVQIFLAGEGIFGIKAGPKLDDQDSLNAHRDFGFILADFGAALLLILALLAWYPNKRIRAMTIVLPFVLFLQGVLGGGSRWVGAFHPLVAFVILGLLGRLSYELWRTPTAVDRPEEASAVPNV